MAKRNADIKPGWRGSARKNPGACPERFDGSLRAANEEEGRMQGKVQIALRAWMEAVESGYETELLENELSDMVEMWVRPQYRSVPARLTYYTEQLQLRHFGWQESWWARGLEWLDRQLEKVGLGLPGPAHWMLYGAVPFIALRTHTLSNGVMDRVRQQREVLIQHGEKPSMILVGRQAMYSIQGKTGDYLEGYKDHSTGALTWRVFGLELKVSPWLEDDAVVVV